MKTWNFASHTLHRMVPITVTDSILSDRVLILLHGYESSSDDIIAHLPIEQYASDYHMMIVIPNVTSDYYIDQPDYSIQEFIGHELPRAIQDEYFPEQPCEFCLAGISMGGYGSLLIGSLYPDSYRALLSISGAFITDDVLIGNPEVVGDGTDLRVTDYFRRIFAPYDQLEGSIRKNPAAAVDAATEHDGLPPLYMSCGTDDMLCSRNQKLLKHLRTKELDVTWEEIPGGQHDWDCFHHGFLALMEQMKLTDLP